MSFLYLSCSAIVDSVGEFNNYKSKCLARHGRCEVFQTRKNIAIAVQNSIYLMNTIM